MQDKPVILDINLHDIVIQSADDGGKMNPRGTTIQIDDLKTSIKELGLLVQLMLVRKSPCGKYFLIDGERRLKTLIALKYESYPCMVIDGDVDDEALMIASDSHKSFPPLSVALSLKRMLDRGYTIVKLASIWGKRPDVVSAYVKMLDAHVDVQEAIMDGRMGITVFARMKKLPADWQESIVNSVEEGKPVTMSHVRDSIRILKEEAKSKEEDVTVDNEMLPTVNGIVSQLIVVLFSGAKITPEMSIKLDEAQKLIDQIKGEQ